ncbi:hypothetical protein PC129_g23027 [Phytophthora cactorum]|uniref:Retroviral polymerase SH3-like domain-containing protein n=1 Tax=Phytophthora cactorum TaxID=29920 RepID=A0A329R890_9STRA|nr:hypothetical protein Pcac1_g20708 [Phytophthora cactorum]KAG2838033.1 hypothetical protein PC112_g4646 [Phytophthora cactorum]KAG2840298.1 hypothetical protein PC111_g3503 [Phytophthora cactorum]KAG2864559.1 hypothetical protein PC113_g4442 [Phytophthora cactorum]KAG2875845.1 hypothetical protein PC114_g24502 [Phytophthora cactorum]
MNMARCMEFACGLPLSLWGDAAQYAAYILNWSPRSSNPGRALPLKILTEQTPSLGEIVVFGLLCTMYRDPQNRNFSHRAQQGTIVGIGVGTNGYRVYLPKDRKVVTLQRVKNIKTPDRTQNEQIQRLYLEEDDLEDEEEPVREQARSTEAGDIGEAPVASDRAKNGKKRSKKSKKKKAWTRE